LAITGGTPDGSKPPLLHTSDWGTALFYQRLARYLPSQPPHGLQARVEMAPTSCTDVMDMAAHYIKEIYTIQPLALLFSVFLLRLGSI